MDLILEIDDDGCGRLQFELPADATDEDVAYIESLVPRIETGSIELQDPGPAIAEQSKCLHRVHERRRPTLHNVVRAKDLNVPRVAANQRRRLE